MLESVTTFHSWHNDKCSHRLNKAVLDSVVGFDLVLSDTSKEKQHNDRSSLTLQQPYATPTVLASFSDSPLVPSRCFTLSGL